MRKPINSLADMQKTCRLIKRVKNKDGNRNGMKGNLEIAYLMNHRISNNLFN